ncbi:PhoX family protein [Nocardioides plantarum]|uniref:PhoX family phosphatase n=1 Tax=Nocardioides plantarum TaxID=29299 RepID=A0ABV5K4Y6_9ACTN|nr:PhoX family phosphatase [Nocardioides plantarum]
MTLSTGPSVGRRLLPITPRHDAVGAHSRSSRDPMTCLFRCGNACDHPEPNRSDHGHVQDEIAKVVGRRGLLQSALLGGGALVIGGSVAGAGRAAAATSAVAPSGTATAGAARAAAKGGDLTRSFTAVRPNKRDAVTTAAGHTSSVVVRWGDPVVPGAVAFDAAAQTPAAARTQFGYNCDYVGVLPLVPGKPLGDDALLVVNHEYTDENLMFPAETYTDDEIKAVAIANHGMSVLQIRRGAAPGSWKRITPSSKTPKNRRIHAGTGFRLDGPAAGDERLRTAADPTGTLVRGTFGNCAGGMTPWGTVLSGEENFNGYFDKSGELDPRYTAEYARYGIAGSGKGWRSVDPRFDLTVEPHEPHRFGWIVEVDPHAPKMGPRKHTMLGRFKHEGANVIVSANGHAVVYMGDDERGDYLYKFVSAAKVDKRTNLAGRNANKELLTAGTLYVAKLTGDGSDDGQYDGTGRWLKLCTDTTSFVPGMSVADVLIFTRLAADKLAPTKMDRPEDVEPNPVNGRIYAALTNNSDRGKSTMPVDEANPLASSMVRTAPGAPLTSASGNRNGYVLEIAETGRLGHADRYFAWNLMLVCGDPAAAETWFGGFDKSQVSPISCPDNVSFDSAGNLWISTDGNVLGSNDGIFRVPVEGARRGQVLQFLTVPLGAEACGPLVTDSDRSLFFAVQHPGEITGATFEKQSSTWPHTDDFPRPSVCVAYVDR